MKLSLLVVCTGNICRSPAGERLLAIGLEGSTDISVSSAGTGALVGHPVDTATASVMTANSVPVDGFGARQLTPPIVRDADLIFTMTAEHRAAVVRLAPASVRRVFLIKEFAQVLAEESHTWVDLPTDPAERLAAAIPLVTAARTIRSARLGKTDFDVTDPYRQPQPVVERVFHEISDAVSAITSFAHAGRAHSVA